MSCKLFRFRLLDACDCGRIYGGREYQVEYDSGDFEIVEDRVLTTDWPVWENGTFVSWHETGKFPDLKRLEGRIVKLEMTGVPEFRYAEGKEVVANMGNIPTWKYTVSFEKWSLSVDYEILVDDGTHLMKRDTDKWPTAKVYGWGSRGLYGI